MIKKRKQILFLLIFLFSLATIFSYQYRQLYKENQRKKLIFKLRRAEWLTLQQKLTDEIAKFKGEVGIIIKDLETDWEISSNKDRLFPSASLAKVPIMGACFLAIKEGKLKLEQNVKLKSSDKFSGTGILKNASPGTVYSVEKIIGLMIYESDNTATNMLTNLVGIDYLNSAFKAFGLKNTDLSRKVADYRSRNKGIENYTTAFDIASILEKIYRGNLINKNVSEKCMEFLKLQRIADRIPKYLPVDIMTAHKTGLERGVCHDAGIVFTRKGDFLICVLTKHKEQNSNSAKKFIARISLYTYNYFEKK